MAAKDPRSVAQKWSRNTAGSGEEMRAGIQRVSESPTKKAAGRLDSYMAGIQAALDSGKTRRNMESVTLEDWQQAALEKGVPNAMAAARRDSTINNVLNFQEQFLPFVEQVAERVRRMPSGTLADGIARAVAQMEGNAEFQYRRRR